MKTEEIASLRSLEHTPSSTNQLSTVQCLCFSGPEVWRVTLVLTQMLKVPCGAGYQTQGFPRVRCVTLRNKLFPRTRITNFNVFVLITHSNTKGLLPEQCMGITPSSAQETMQYRIELRYPTCKQVYLS